MRHLLAPFVLLAAMTACSGPSGDEKPANQAAGAASGAGNAAQSPAPSAPAKPVQIASKTGQLDFAYSWPAQAAAIPALDAWLRAHAEGQQSKAEASAKADAADAKANDYAFNGESYSESWSVAADIPSLLVLQADGDAYTGGAHGMPFVASLIWDKAAGKRLPVSALFDMGALVRAAKDRFCKALDAERAERRGEPVDPNDDDQIPEFVRCVDMAKQEIIAVSKGGKAIDTVRVVILPYEAGSFAEGTYQIELPIDAALRAAVKPAWKSSFAGG